MSEKRRARMELPFDVLSEKSRFRKPASTARAGNRRPPESCGAPDCCAHKTRSRILQNVFHTAKRKLEDGQVKSAATAPRLTRPRSPLPSTVLHTYMRSLGKTF